MSSDTPQELSLAGRLNRYLAEGWSIAAAAHLAGVSPPVAQEIAARPLVRAIRAAKKSGQTK